MVQKSFSMPRKSASIAQESLDELRFREKVAAHPLTRFPSYRYMVPTNDPHRCLFKIELCY